MPTTSIDPNTTLEQLLLAMPEHGPVLECLGIDATREGNRTLAELCASRGLESRTVARVLAATWDARPRAPVVCVELMTPAQLCDHLEHAHRNLHDELERLDRLTKVLAREHAIDHPKLRAIRKSFVAFQRPFKAHLRKESEALFPVIRRLEAGADEAHQARLPLRSPLADFVREHSKVDEALADLRILASDDSSPSSTSAAAAMRTISEAIARLERSIHEQIFKENHILFPQALAI